MKDIEAGDCVQVKLRGPHGTEDKWQDHISLVTGVMGHELEGASNKIYSVVGIEGGSYIFLNRDDLRKVESDTLGERLKLDLDLHKIVFDKDFPGIFVAHDLFESDIVLHHAEEWSSDLLHRLANYIQENFVRKDKVQSTAPDVALEYTLSTEELQELVEAVVKRRMERK